MFDFNHRNVTIGSVVDQNQLMIDTNIWMDDLTVVLEVVYLTTTTYSKRHVPCNIPVHNNIIDHDKLKTQNYLESWTDKKKMVLNEKRPKT